MGALEVAQQTQFGSHGLEVHGHDHGLDQACVVERDDEEAAVLVEELGGVVGGVDPPPRVLPGGLGLDADQPAQRRLAGDEESGGDDLQGAPDNGQASAHDPSKQSKGPVAE